jgi:hypothetical protein
MIPKLVDYLNHPILVSIPALHSDARCRSYALRGVEMQGLWLQSEELAGHVAPADTGGYREPLAVAFVPFSQIACVLLPRPYRRSAGLSIGTRRELTHSKPTPVHDGAQKRTRERETHAREPQPKVKPKK